ncbi:hypothetical protein POM88_008753 [Heracleum sosnowskyi]|uniref:glutathione transferase n=2 Tax=Heracleum sosnowskyi TaxID=360622 RepID=A0AAD8JAE8_9APIA|nr:hypothetical protein POM88_008753 [Heracleum sosnowskyi]
MCVLQLLSSKRIQSFRNVRDEEVALLIQRIKDSPSKVINLKNLFATLANNIVCRVALGKKYEGGRGVAFKKLLEELSELLSYSGLGIYIPWLYWVDNFKGVKRRVEKVANELDDFLEGVVTDHIIALENNGAVNQDFVSILLENLKKKTDNGFSIDKECIKAVTMDMFTAGTNTTSSTLEWTMAMLMKNPDIMDKLQNEEFIVGIDQAMAGIKVHGVKVSTCSQRAFATLNEKGLDFQLVPVDMQNAEHKKQPYLSLNPFGQIPVLEDGDLKIFESRAITQYIAYAYADKGNPLVVQDQKKMAIVSVWMQVEAQHFDPPASRIGWELVYKPMFGQQTDNAAVEENEAKLAKVLDIYEARLTESKYLGGDCFTLADLNHLPAIKILMGTPSSKLFESRSHVKAWCDDIQARPSWQKVISM